MAEVARPLRFQELKLGLASLLPAEESKAWRGG